VAGQLDGVRRHERIVEYSAGARTISRDGRATITNMGAELGATTSMFRGRAHGDLPAATARRCGAGGDAVPAPAGADKEVEDRPREVLRPVVRLDRGLEPYVVGPHFADRARPIGKLAPRCRTRQRLSRQDLEGLIGSLHQFLLRGHEPAADVASRPGARSQDRHARSWSRRLRTGCAPTIERDGQMQSLKTSTGVVLANACGPCIGQWRRSTDEAAVPNTIVTSYTEKLPRRNDGQRHDELHRSPEVVTASPGRAAWSVQSDHDTLTGATASRQARPPKSALRFRPELRPRPAGLRRSAPPTAAGITLRVDPRSERLQLMEPWPAWTPGLQDMPVLLKTKGKTTTDHILAGSWLR